MSDYSLNWKGDEVLKQTIELLKKAVGEIGLSVESEAKQELQPGHGVITGTLRRSIHTAEPGFGWSGESGGGEGGGASVEGQEVGGKIVVEVGTGLKYAIWVHQGHHSFGGYHFLTNGVNKTVGKVPAILAKYKLGS